MTVGEYLRDLVAAALSRLQDAGEVRTPEDFEIRIEPARQKGHGDYACNAALTLARHARMNPRELARKVTANLAPSEWVSSVDIAGPGFINFSITQAARVSIIEVIRAEGGNYGYRQAAVPERLNVEFVSANPTGPLHVGHGRGAAFGDTLARVLQANGHAVDREYYVNDAGRQMDILALSVWLRYLELGGERFRFPENAYRGQYVVSVAQSLRQRWGDRLLRPAAAIVNDLPEDQEQALDTMIARARSALGKDDFELVFALARDTQVADIRDDLKEFRVEYDRWFSERSLADDGTLSRALGILGGNDHLYESQGALWFRSTAFGDEKDRVVRRANGTFTYFASDIAYLLNKAERGFDRMIYVWGADHHGMVVRLKAAFSALGFDPRRLVVLLVQFAVLYRGEQKVSMSTRSGEFVTLRELRDEVGNDAARFFYVLRKPDQHMDFDLELAKSESSDNPVYYVQYAHARICSVFKQLREHGLDVQWDQAGGAPCLTEEQELDLLAELARFPDVVEIAGAAHEPHQIAYYLRDVATLFHRYYNAHPFLGAEETVRAARLALVDATRQVIANGLALLGVSAPAAM